MQTRRHGDTETRRQIQIPSPRPRVPASPRPAFSLVELLVVIAIIAVLISFLMPALVTAQRQAETTKCKNNLQQIYYALAMYTQENQGYLPAWSGWHTWPQGTSEDSVGPAWTVELIPYLNHMNPDGPIYNCPSFRGKDKMRNYFLAAQWTGRSNKHAMKLTDVTGQCRTKFVLSGDKTQRGLYPPPFGTSEHLLDDADPDDSGSGMPVLAWPWEQGGFYMHRNGNNILFDDGHVALFSAYDKDNMTFNPHRMENWADVTAD